MQTTYIYALLDPRTREIRYIGKADDLQHRLEMHLAPANLRGNTHKQNWIRSLLSKGLRPTIQLVDEVLRSEWPAAEAAYIAFYREEGCDLVNLHPGGIGAGGGKDHPMYGLRGEKSPIFGKPKSPEHRAKIIERLRGYPPPMIGKKHSPESRAKMSRAQKGRKLSPERIEKIRLGHIGLKRSPESIAKGLAKRKGKTPDQSFRTPAYYAKLGASLSAKFKGRKLSPETCAKISASKKGKPSGKAGAKHHLFGKKLPLEYRAKISASLKGRKHTQESLQKMRIAQLKRRERERAMSGQLELLPAA